MSAKTEESRAAYNKIAAEYDSSPEGRYTRFHIKELSETIDLRDGDVVLDVACGNGTLLRELSKKAEIRGNGIDVSENMIRAAKARCPDMHFEALSCYPLRWRDNSVDVITTCCAFHHFDNPRRFVDECKRVLKENASVYIAEPNFGPMVSLFANTLWFRVSKSGDVRVYSSGELKAFFDSAGFKMVEVYQKEKGLFLKATK